MKRAGLLHLICGITALLAAAETVVADEIESDIRHCAGIDNEGDRLACFDTIAARLIATEPESETGVRRYSTERDGDRGRERYGYGYRSPPIRIVGFYHAHRDGRSWRRYIGDDGSDWRVRKA